MSPFESVVMDRLHEPPAAFEDYPIAARLSGSFGGARIWKMPVPLRVTYTGFKSAGVTAPFTPSGKNAAITVAVHGFPSLLTYPGPRHWLVTTMALPGYAPPPELFEGAEAPTDRIDGAPCTGVLTATSSGSVYMGFVDLKRPSMESMVNPILERDPNSKLPIRLLPRYARGALRLYRSLNCFQFWAAI